MSEGDEEIVLRVRRVASIFGEAMLVAPLVRKGIITDREGSELVQLRYGIAWCLLEREEPE